MAKTSVDAAAPAPHEMPVPVAVMTFRLSAWHGASIVYDGATEEFRHVRFPERWTEAEPVRLHRISSEPVLGLLEYGSAKCSRVVPVLVAGDERDGVRMMRPSTGQALTVVIGSEEHDAGAVVFGEPSGSVRERFGVRIDDDHSAPAMVRTLSEIATGSGTLLGADAIVTVAHAFPDVLADLIAAIASEDLRGMVPVLAGTDAWPVLFPLVRRRLGSERTGYPPPTREAMSEKIRSFSWSIGDHSYGEPIVLDGVPGYLTIGRFCSIAGNVVIALRNHTTWTATSFPFASLPGIWPTAAASAGLEDHVSRPVSIGHDVWIGFGAVILPGTEIGHGSVIGANAVVRGEVAPYSIMAGNPARCIKKRFDDESIDRLMRLRWWDWPDDRIDRYIPLLLDPQVERFLAAAEADPL